MVCSFGDASVNHSTAAGAINTALNTAYPGICRSRSSSSARTTAGASRCRPRRAGSRRRTDPGRGSDYFVCRRCRCRSEHARRASTRPSPRVRGSRRPVFLHLRTVRFLGHAGSDAEIGYREPRDIERRLPTATRSWRPLRLLVSAGVASRTEILGRYDEIRSEIDAEAERLRDARPGCDAAEVMAPLRPGAGPRAAEPVEAIHRAASRSGRRDPATLAESINATLDRSSASTRARDRLRRGRRRQGRRLRRDRGLARQARGGPGLRHPARRAVDPRVSALGAGLAGLLPMPEIQYLAYLHNAEDQLRGEARHAAVLLPRRVPQPDGRPGRRAGLPAGLRRPLPQRQRGRLCCATSPAWWSPARPGPTTRPRMLRTCVAAAATRRHAVGVPGADRALPPARPVRRRRQGLAGRR